MDMFNLFEIAGISIPAVEEQKKEAPKKEVKKGVKKATTKPLAKVTIKLPTNAYIQAFGKVSLTSELFDGKEEVSDEEIKAYLNKAYSLKEMVFIFDKNQVFAGYTGQPVNSTSLNVKEGDVAIFGNFSCSLTEVAGAITPKDLAEFLINSGLPLGDAEEVRFSVKGDVFVPEPVKVTEKDIEGLHLPIAVHMYGDWEDFTITEITGIASEVSEDGDGDSDGGEEKEKKPTGLTLDSLKKAIATKYPEFEGRCVLCALEKGEDGKVGVCCYLNIEYATTPVSKKKEETFKVTSSTSFRFYAMEVPVELAGGDYTLKQICKELAKAGVPECSEPTNIMAKQVGDNICLAVKFGGSKGATADIDVLVDRYIDCPQIPLSEFVENGVYMNVRPCWIFAERENKSEQGFALRTPKLSKEIYNKIVSLFAKFAALGKECLARVYYNYVYDCYTLIVPNQTVTLASVTPHEDELGEDFWFENVPFLEIHSHGKAFNAFFSSTDDASECAKHALYGVFSFDEEGQVRNTKFRVCSGVGREMELSVMDIFDIEDLSFEYDSKFVADSISSTHFKVS